MIVPIVPLPAHVRSLPGSYRVPASITISAPLTRERNAADAVAAFLRRRGITAAIVSTASRAGLRFVTPVRGRHVGKEAYRLRIGRTGMTISATSGAGFFYGVQSLEQLFPADARNRTIADVAIDDAPAFAWRGIMLDVSRHFYDVKTVERFIDLAARYKLNIFHWHLSDDQGWRVEIPQYPRLTSVGSCRAGTEVGKNPRDVEGPAYCGFYTPAQIRAVVAYAAKRYVTIVPEIEMPGHSTAAIAAYPFLSCSGKTIPVSTTWGGSHPICPTHKAIAFEENVLTELMKLFPGPYIHTGGDEVPFGPWKASPFVQALMQRKHLAGYPQVQGYFERRIERFVESKGRRMAGWDEILAGGVSRHAVVMSWHGSSGGIEAARRGNDAVMAPDGTLYLDAYQGDPNQEPLAIGGLARLQTVYGYDPLAGLPTAQQRAHILGVQGNIWTEWIATVPHLFYMAAPRELALSEDAWTPQSNKNWDSFQARMGPQYLWLQRAGINFRIPNPSFSVTGGTLHFANVAPGVQTASVQTAASAAAVTISDPVPNATLVYTTDGTQPGEHARRYTKPLQLRLAPGQHVDVKTAALLPDGRSSTITELRITRSGAR